MPKPNEHFGTLGENKSILCALLFFSYIGGQLAFYSPANKYGIILSASAICIILVILSSLQKKIIIPVLFPVIFYFLFCFGFVNSKLRYVEFDDFSSIDFAKDVEIEGTITSIPKYITTSDTYKFTITAAKISKNQKSFDIKKGKILSSVKNYKKDDLKYGGKIKLKGILSTPNDANNPSEFNYKKFLNNKGILKILYAKGEDVIEVKNDKAKDFYTIQNFPVNFFTIMNDLRDKVIQKHGHYIKSPELEVLGGVVFGDDAVNPPDEVKESFISSGLLHLLAASGLNVGIILTVWLYFIHFFNIPYRIKIISGMVIIFLYSVMTGFPPSIVRASVMLILILIGKLIYRETNGIGLIFMAGLLILIVKPEFITNVGFQLSFIVTFGLIACTPCINTITSKKEKEYIKKISQKPKIIQSILMAFSPASIVCCVAIPLIAQIWASPLQAYYFNTFSNYSIPANIAVVPFIGIISFFGFTSTAFCFIPKISETIIHGLDYILNYIIKIVLFLSNTFASLPNATVIVPSPKIFSILIFYIAVIFIFNSIKEKFKNKIYNFISLFLIIILTLSGINFKQNNDEVIFFSVGNADSALIKTKENKYILIDTGRYIYSGLTSAKTILLEYFFDNNIKELDTLIVTHYDSDHSGGLVDILKNIKVKNLIIHKPVCTSKNSCEIKEYIEKNKIQYKTPHTGQEINLREDFKLTNLVYEDNNSFNKNNSSIVSLIEDGEYKLLFLADVSLNVYKKLENYMPSGITILKASHHGAKDTVNDDMLEKLMPAFSIISTGKNSYGHPDKYTYAKLKQYSKTLNTKEVGAIKFTLGKKLKIYGYNKHKNRFEELFF